MSALSHLDNTASNLVLSSSEKDSIQTSIRTLKIRLKDYFGSEIKEQIQFGSSTRGTIIPPKVDERADVDYMVVFDNPNSYQQNTFIEKLKRFAEAKYNRSEIHRSHPTVVLKLNHISFELVPAVNSWLSGLQIPAPSNSYASWISTDPTGFNNDLIDTNNSNNFTIKPLIRLMKYWNVYNG